MLEQSTGHRRTVVFKVGGSLLDCEDLASRLQSVMAQRADCRIVLFPGGGPTADVVREWDRRWSLGEEVAHHLAIDALCLNARMLSALLPSVPLVEGLEDSAAVAPAVLLSPAGFLAACERRFPDDAPPHLWDVTSDSLAAWTAMCWPAEELVLLKSIAPPVGMPATTASRERWVDPYFPGLAGRLPRVSWCNLRASDAKITPWLCEGAVVV